MSLNLFKSLTVASLIFGSSLSSAYAGNDVTLYASNNTAAVDALLGVVSRTAPDLNVQVVSASTGALLTRIKAEAANPQADVFWSAGYSTLDSYQDNFQPYEAKTKLPENVTGGNGLWAGSNVHVMVLMINKRQLGDLPAPTSWSDILKPEWKGKFVFGDPVNSSSAYAQLFGLYKLFGSEGLEKLAQNAVVVGSSSSTYTAPAAGEYPLGITMEYSAQAYVAGGQREISLVYPSEGTFLSPEGLAIIKNAKNTASASRLLEIMTSKEAQEAVFKATFRRPANTEVDVNALSGLPNLNDIKVINIDPKEASAQRDEVIAIWQKALGNQ